MGLVSGKVTRIHPKIFRGTIAQGHLSSGQSSGANILVVIIQVAIFRWGGGAASLEGNHPRSNCPRGPIIIRGGSHPGGHFPGTFPRGQLSRHQLHHTEFSFLNFLKAVSCVRMERY